MGSSIVHITILFSVLIAVIIIYFFVSIISHHRRYMRLQRERIFAEITMQENERKRIASDLHDSLGPLLSAVKLNINCIDVQPEDQEIIDKTGKHLDEIISSMRRISHNLLPHTLERKGLIEAVREFVGQINQHKKLDIQLYIITEVSVSKDKEIHIFRILQEIIHNALKHSQASQLQIGIDRKDDHMVLFTQDNGKGFNKEKIQASSSGLGLKSLESRCEIIHGIMTLQSSPEEGTKYFIKIPLS